MRCPGLEGDFRTGTPVSEEEEVAGPSTGGRKYPPESRERRLPGGARAPSPDDRAGLTWHGGVNTDYPRVWDRGVNAGQRFGAGERLLWRTTRRPARSTAPSTPMASAMAASLVDAFSLLARAHVRRLGRLLPVHHAGFGDHSGRATEYEAPRRGAAFSSPTPSSGEKADPRVFATTHFQRVRVLTSHRGEMGGAPRSAGASGGPRRAEHRQ